MSNACITRGPTICNALYFTEFFVVLFFVVMCHNPPRKGIALLVPVSAIYTFPKVRYCFYVLTSQQSKIMCMVSQQHRVHDACITLYEGKRLPPIGC